LATAKACLLAALLVPGSANAATEAHGDSARIARWHEDLGMFHDLLLRRHVRLFWRTSRAEFDRQVDSLARQIPELSDAQIVTGMTRAAAIADAHTGLEWGSGAVRFRSLPFFVRRFAEGWFVVAGAPEVDALLGTRLVAVNDMPVEDVVAALSPFVSHDNDAWRDAQLPEWLMTPEMLQAAGVLPDPLGGAFTFEDSLGRRLDAFLRSVPPGDSTRWTSYVESRRVPIPLARAQPSLHYWFRWLPESRALLLRYNQCAEMASAPFRGFTDSLLSVADSLAPQRLVVDLRANSGGDSRLLHRFAAGLRRRPALNRRLFVLVGRHTYSSAVMNAHELRRRTRAILVGEPTGGKPNAYGEWRNFSLPHSGIRVRYSTRFFRLVKGADPPSLLPDLETPVTWEDWRTGRDRALETALSYGEPEPATGRRAAH
jgi:hypothetical protein